MNQFFAAGSFVFHIIALQGHHVYLAGILLVRIGNLLYHNCPSGNRRQNSLPSPGLLLTLSFAL